MLPTKIAKENRKNLHLGSRSFPFKETDDFLLFVLLFFICLHRQSRVRLIKKRERETQTRQTKQKLSCDVDSVVVGMSTIIKRIHILCTEYKKISLYGFWLLSGLHRTLEILFSLIHCICLYVVEAIRPGKLSLSAGGVYRLNCTELPFHNGNTARRADLISVAFILVLFIFNLFGVILWFWSWVCLTFSSPWVREILHSVSLYPQPPAVCLNQKQKQPRRKESERETKCGSRGRERVGNRGYIGEMIKV